MVISFDLWGTLIKGNPLFKIAKNNLIREFSALPNKDLLNDYFINDRISVIKKRSDDMVEEYGTQPNTKHLFAELSSEFSIPASKFLSFYHEYQSLFIEYTPPFYCDQTYKYLQQISNQGNEIAISSNTLFASPDTMLIITQKIGIRRYSKSMKFSGNIGLSKPSVECFFANADIHVGDNVKTDGQCVRFGTEFYQINSNEKTIKDLHSYVSLRNQN